LFKSADGTKVILVDVTSGISKHAKLHQYTPVAGMIEESYLQGIFSFSPKVARGSAG
jgi:hypothetical protein